MASRKRTPTAPALPVLAPEVVEQAARLLRPFHWLTAPKSYGLEHIPERGPLLFVGNHTLFGVLDAPVMFYELYAQRGIFPRALGDHRHFRVPVWRDLLTRYGVVDGTPDNCAGLMQAHESILVFPGGGREVAKRKGEKYKLIWKQRVGFARLAIRFGCPIVPFAAVGAEESFDIVFDANDLMASPVGTILKRLGADTEVIMPFATGLAGTPLPRPERLYFRFGPLIRTERFERRHDDDAACFALRREVESAVRRGIRFLRAEQRRDPERQFVTRLIKQLRRG